MCIFSLNVGTKANITGLPKGELLISVWLAGNVLKDFTIGWQIEDVQKDILFLLRQISSND